MICRKDKNYGNQNYFSYGREKDLLEIQGLMTNEEKKIDTE